MHKISIYPTLLKDELHKNGSFFIKANITQNYIQEEEIKHILLNIIHLIQDDYNKNLVISIDSIVDYFSLLTQQCLQSIHEENIPENQKLLLCLIYLSLKMTKLSDKSIEFLHVCVRMVKELSEFHEELQVFLDSYDLRGAYFHFYKVFLDVSFYDKSMESLTYEYSPPKINTEWIKKYRKSLQPIEFWFYDSFKNHGIFLILYTPKCRYAKCSFCNLPSLSSETMPNNQELIYKQVDYTFKELISPQENHTLNEIILSNNGNLFDIKTMPTLSLLYAIDSIITKLPNLKKIILESRIEYITDLKITLLMETITLHKKNIELEIAVGFEVFNESSRNQYLQKGLSLTMVDNLVALLSKHNISIKFYLLFHADPSMTLQESITDINNAESYFSTLTKKYQAKINIHISPTYVATGTQLEKDFLEGRYTPPDIYDIQKLYNKLTVYKNLSYYISLNNEGLSQKDYFEKNYDNYLEIKHKIHQFNISNIKV